MILGKDELGAELAKFVMQPDVVLFSGAGVGKRAGLPDWNEYVEELASIVEPYEAATADLMRTRWAEGLLGEAVRLYKACPKLPAGDKFSGLAAPILRRDSRPDRIRALMALPFTAVVTTNFDRTQHEAYVQATDQAPYAAEYNDPSLKEAMYNWSEFFIARIHGRVEVPTTLIVTDDDFHRVVEDSAYGEFLHFILTRRRCLFLGFSFVDPAIEAVLKVYDERVGPNFPKRHLAVLPKSAAKTLIARLPRMNIRTYQYEDDREHSELWSSIRVALDTVREEGTFERRQHPEPHEMARRILAIAFARFQLGDEIEPLREVVVDGLALGLLSESRPHPRSQLAGDLRVAMGLTRTESEVILRESLRRLASRGWIEESKETVQRKLVLEDDLTGALRVLLEGVRQRLIVRYDCELRKSSERALGKLLEDLVLLRGWELGAEFSSARGSDFYGLDETLNTLFEQHRSRFFGASTESIRLATRDLLKQPTESESEILNRLGRVAFGVELALDRGASTFTKRMSLPEAVYLDASYLLPAIVVGHPLNSAYSGAIQRLVDSASTAGSRCRVMVLEAFLNEVVAHRDKAELMVKSSGLGSPEDLARFIDFVGAQNTNVFVGGYSSFIQRVGSKVEARLTFLEYLNQYAPYRTEESLANYLEGFGLETIPSAEVGKRIGSRRTVFLDALRESYESQSAPFPVRKAGILIKHEARQLSILDVDLGSGVRSVFVTADRWLRKVARGELLARVADSVLSNTAFLQLVDLLSGLKIRNQDSLARLLWAVDAVDGKGVLRGYLLDRGLREYDAGVAMKLPHLAERIASEISKTDSEKIRSLDRVRDSDGARETLRLLDRFEDKFFEGMASEVQKLRSKEGS